MSLSYTLHVIKELKESDYLLWTVDVSALMVISSFGSLCPDLVEELFDFVLRVDSSTFICPSTESDMISIISKFAGPVFFKTLTLPRN